MNFVGFTLIISNDLSVKFDEREFFVCIAVILKVSKT